MPPMKAGSLTGLILGSSSVARLAHTERGLPRPINDSDGTGRLDSRLRRSPPDCASAIPMDKPGKTQCVSPTLPTGRRLPHKLHSTPQQHGMILLRVSGNDQTSSRLPAFSLFFPRKLSKQPGPSHDRQAPQCVRGTSSVLRVYRGIDDAIGGQATVYIC